MALDGVSLTVVNDRASESGEQDKIARMFRLILLYIVHNINP